MVARCTPQKILAALLIFVGLPGIRCRRRTLVTKYGLQAGKYRKNVLYVGSLKSEVNDLCLSRKVTNNNNYCPFYQFEGTAIPLIKY
jgi:hypothetical protein